LQTDIEVRVPQQWNGRLLHVGGGGFDGSIPNLGGQYLNAGYAMTGSNGGHRSSAYPGATFGLNNTLVADYAHKAIGYTIGVAKAAVQSLFTRRADFTYFQGCSNGGRGALNAAAKYGAEYDGVIAGAPTRNLPGLVSLWSSAAQQPNKPSAAKLTSLYNAYVQACDADDGVKDGVVSSAPMCKFNPQALLCTGESNNSCLTQPELNAVAYVTNDLRLADGTVVHSKFGIANGSVLGSGQGLGYGHLQYIVYQNPAYNGATFNLNNDYPVVKDRLDEVFDFSASVPDLSAFVQAGKKIIVWQGMEDALLSPYDTVRTMNEVKDASGRAHNNVKVFLMPGMGHCGGGPGAGSFDLVTALAQWVESGGQLNDRDVTASRVVGGNTVFTRPLCEHPKYPHYSGDGDPTVASSYICKNMPAPRR
jgi:feruloyl esterase